MRKLKLALLAGLASASTVAYAFPWDIDMSDATFLRAYEWQMTAPPEGSVSRNRERTTGMARTPAADALVNPVAADDVTLRQGERMFTVYCQTCHGAQGAGGAPMTDNTDGKKRYTFPVPTLSGAGSRSAGLSDGSIYLTMRNGSLSKLMPSYSWAMTEEEMWSVVAYIRTLPGAARPTE